MIERNNVGRAFRLFKNIKVQLNGYLIGWKYYYKNSTDMCSSNSYVTVFGKRGSNQNYKHIASTLLQQKSTESGLRVQFVQKDRVPVQSNDLLGIYTVNCATNAKHLVSAETNSDDPKHVYKKAPVTVAEVEDTLSMNSFNDNQRLRVSLQAYVAGLLD